MDDDHTWRKISVVASFVLIFAVFFLSTAQSLYSYVRSRVALERESVTNRVMLLRARLEQEVYARIALERGLASLFELRPDVTQSDFGRYASSLAEGDDVIRNVSVLRGTVIEFVYPFESNKSAIGVDLADVPEQRSSILRARDSGGITFTGPVRLVQGGEGLVSRLAIHVPSPDGGESYWGQVGVVLEIGNLVKAARTFAYPELRVAIRNAAGRGTFVGDPGVFDGDPVLMDVSIPDSPWEIGAVPQGGWNRHTTEFILSAAFSALIAGGIAFLVASLVAARYAMRDLAFFDHLTGLPNRKLFWDRFAHSEALATRRQLSVAVFVLDLDGFKGINDRYGHSAGDRLLRAVAERLESSVRGADTLARVGGDEFVIQVMMERGDGTPERVSERIDAVFAEPFSVPREGTPVGVSYGHAVWPDEGADGQTIFDLADSRMYQMKRRRGHRL